MGLNTRLLLWSVLLLDAQFRCAAGSAQRLFAVPTKTTNPDNEHKNQLPGFRTAAPSTLPGPGSCMKATMRTLFRSVPALSFN